MSTECESCGAEDFVDDYKSGDVICRMCGLVQMERVLSEQLIKKPADSAEAYDLKIDADSTSNSMQLARELKRPKRTREIEALMKKIGDDLSITPRSIDAGYLCFQKFKEQRGVNKHTHTLALAAILLAIDLCGEVCTFSSLASAWSKYVDDYEIRRTVVERCEGELLKFLKRSCSKFLADMCVKNSVYIRNLMVRVLRDIEMVAQSTMCVCNMPLSERACVCHLIKRLHESTGCRATILWVTDVCLEYDSINKLLNPKKKLKPLAALAVNILFTKTISGFETELKLAFNTAILAPRTDVEYTSINYLARKLETFKRALI